MRWRRGFAAHLWHPPPNPLLVLLRLDVLRQNVKVSTLFFAKHAHFPLLLPQHLLINHVHVPPFSSVLVDQSLLCFFFPPRVRPSVGNSRALCCKVDGSLLAAIGRYELRFDATAAAICSY